MMIKRNKQVRPAGAGTDTVPGAPGSSRRKSRMKAAAAAASLCLCLCLVLCGCGGSGPAGADGTDSSPVTAEETTAASPAPTHTVVFADREHPGDPLYDIVRPDEASKGEISAMQTVKNAVIEAYSCNLPLKTDWLNPRTGEEPPEKEILVGKTSRPETAEVLASLDGTYSYAIKVCGQKLVITGGCDVATLYAAKEFAKSLPRDALILEEGFTMTGEVPVTERVLAVSGEDEAARGAAEIYPGVLSVHYSLTEGSAYGLQKFVLTDFDPEQSDLYFRVVKGGETAVNLVSVPKTVDIFNKNNTEGLKVLTAVNGDLWMVSSAHARVPGSGTVYKNCSDPVVRKSLTLPRGYNVYGGEIITSAHMEQETPYEGKFYAFGITEDGQAVFGCPEVIPQITVGEKQLTADGVNRLPANNALVVYTDVYSRSTYSLEDAYEVVIDCADDYTLFYGSAIKGTVTAVCPSGSAKQDMKQKRLILCARGSRTALLSDIRVGDTVTLEVSVRDSTGDAELWKNVRNAVGGHIPVIINGKSTNSKDGTKYPMTVLGLRDDGHVIILQNDGRQSGWSVGITISQLDELCAELGIRTAFLLDGGGSSEQVTLQSDGTYKTEGRPSDGSSRSVVNTVILAVGPKKN